MPSHDTNSLAHIAIIMDGNGRWADSNGFSRNKGHEKGTENLQSIVKKVSDLNIQFLTIYAFSTENWNRPKLEVSNLMNLLFDSINKQLDILISNNIRVVHLGEKSSLPSNLQKALSKCEESTKNNSGLTLNVALNYGGRTEILHSVRKLVSQNVLPHQISLKDIDDNLYTAGIPDPDLIIRTGGEKRISNFLLWQSAYSEYYFSDVFWPDFTSNDLEEAIHTYYTRKRRFGMTKLRGQ